ncbi:hypothetical protein ACFVOK_14040 [Streptomyces sp. NPDC057798]|uniref:hypothetical protein n=1 Tax=Streptomyces sp. NPDC057798 TaxID=3346252 RepID=UPI00369314FF
MIPRTFPPAPGWSPDGHRITSEVDYGRGPERTWVYGALRVRDGHVVTMTASSWINQVERWFGLLTDKLIRRGVNPSVKALEDDIRTWIVSWNESPKPFTWTKTADEILRSLADYLTKVTPPAIEDRQET